MDAMPDFDQLQLRFVDHVQWRYELIRPVVLMEHRTAAQRAEETHTHPETVRDLTRRFRQQGTLGLFPEHTSSSGHAGASRSPKPSWRNWRASKPCTMDLGIANWPGLFGTRCTMGFFAQPPKRYISAIYLQNDEKDCFVSD